MQSKVKVFNDQISRKQKMPISARFMDIGSELGELEKEYLKASNYGTKEFEMTTDFEMEYGDVLYSLLSLGCECNLDAEMALQKVLDKYTKRLSANGSMGSKKE